MSFSFFTQDMSKTYLELGLRYFYMRHCKASNVNTMPDEDYKSLFLRLLWYSWLHCSVSLRSTHSVLLLCRCVTKDYITAESLVHGSLACCVCLRGSVGGFASRASCRQISPRFSRRRLSNNDISYPS